eukprot:gene2730-12603_t
MFLPNNVEPQNGSSNICIKSEAAGDNSGGGKEQEEKSGGGKEPEENSGGGQEVGERSVGGKEPGENSGGGQELGKKSVGGKEPEENSGGGQEQEEKSGGGKEPGENSGSRKEEGDKSGGGKDPVEHRGGGKEAGESTSGVKKPALPPLGLGRGLENFPSLPTKQMLVGGYQFPHPDGAAPGTWRPLNVNAKAMHVGVMSLNSLPKGHNVSNESHPIQFHGFLPSDNGEATLGTVSESIDKEKYYYPGMVITSCWDPLPPKKNWDSKPTDDITLGPGKEDVDNFVFWQEPDACARDFGLPERQKAQVNHLPIRKRLVSCTPNTPAEHLKRKKFPTVRRPMDKTGSKRLSSGVPDVSGLCLSLLAWPLLKDYTE